MHITKVHQLQDVTNYHRIESELPSRTGLFLKYSIKMGSHGRLLFDMGHWFCKLCICYVRYCLPAM